MRRRRKSQGLLLGLIALLSGLWGCEQRADLRPRLDAVRPAAWVAGREGYVTIEGRFSPGMAWDEDGPRTQEQHRVLFGGQESPEVHLLSPRHLSARLPEGGLAVGSTDLEVRGPDGSSARLSGALCASEDASLKLMSACSVEGSFGICEAELSGEVGELKLLAPGALGFIAVDPFLYQAIGLAPAYAIDPLGKHLLYLRASDDGSGAYNLELCLQVLDSDEEPQVIDTRKYMGEKDVLRLRFPLLAPDGRYLIYIADDSRLMLRELDPESGTPGETRMLLDAEEDEPDSVLMWPQVDPSGTLLLVMRVVPLKDDMCMFETAATHRGELLLVDLESGRLRQRFRPDNPCRSDGPGVFHPAGDRVLFLSNRDGRFVATPYGAIQPSNSLYVRKLSGDESVQNLLRFNTVLLMGAPMLSGDGGLAALCGTSSDLSGFGWDALLLDVATGTVQRLVNEVAPDCQPPIREACTPGEIFGDTCCGSLGQCCDTMSGENCPTWDLAPAFRPDGQALIYNGSAYYWQCEEGLAGPAWRDQAAPGLRAYWAQPYPAYDRWLVVELTSSEALLDAYLGAPSFVERPECTP